MLLETGILIVILFLTWTVKINVQSKLRNLPPGPLEFPIVGSFFQMINQVTKEKRVSYNIYQSIAKKYGPLARIQYGKQRQIVIDDPDLIKEVLSSDAWSDRHFDIFFGIRSFDHPYGVLFSNGDEWKEMRRFTLRTLRDFGFGRRSQESVLQDELSDLNSRLDAKIGLGGGEALICMDQLFTVSVLNILWFLVAGERFSQEDPRLLELNDKASQVSRATPVGINPINAFPFLSIRSLILGYSKNGRTIVNFMKEIHGFLRSILEERRSKGCYREHQSDFVDIFLKKIDERQLQSKPPSPNYYNDNQFITVLLDLFMAGSETTSNTLEFAILYSILNPHVITKVQEEIDSVVGQNRLPIYSTDRPKMPYTEATLLEVQRMANVVPVDNRNASQDTTLDGYTIPKGSVGILNLRSAHFNESVWGDPYVFRPERFLDSAANVVNASKVMAFGMGKRVCIGEAMARATLFTFYTSFLQKYTLEQDPGQPPPSAIPRNGFTLSPKPYNVLIKHR